MIKHLTLLVLFTLIAYQYFDYDSGAGMGHRHRYDSVTTDNNYYGTSYDDKRKDDNYIQFDYGKRGADCYQRSYGYECTERNY